MDVLSWFWHDYPVVVDLALYFFVFAAAARAAGTRSFPGREAVVHESHHPPLDTVLNRYHPPVC